jgi:hypothetical protein
MLDAIIPIKIVALSFFVMIGLSLIVDGKITLCHHLYF